MDSPGRFMLMRLCICSLMIWFHLFFSVQNLILQVSQGFCVGGKKEQPKTNLIYKRDTGSLHRKQWSPCKKHQSRLGTIIHHGCTVTWPWAQKKSEWGKENAYLNVRIQLIRQSTIVCMRNTNISTLYVEQHVPCPLHSTAGFLALRRSFIAYVFAVSSGASPAAKF